jgi:hypothetical protein
VFYSVEASANILSLAHLVDSGGDVRYEAELDQFTLRPSISNSLYIFRRKSVAGSEGRFYVCQLSTLVETTKISAAYQHQLALVQTVEDNMQRYTKREVGGATRARDMLCKMGYPSVQQVIAMVESGMNFDITAHDFRIAEAIWGPDIASIKGKTRKMGTAPADTVIAPIVAQQDQVLSVDIMFTDGVATLVGLVSPLVLTLAATLTSFDTYRGPRSTAVIKAALDGFIATLASRNFKTRIIMTDGEGAIGKLKTALNLDGIEVDISGAGGHVPVIERRIQVIKQRVRAYMSHRLPYTLNTQGIGYCVLFCASRLNYEVPGTRPMGPSPREILTDARARGDLGFRCSFGDFALTTVPQTTNSPTARVEEAIVMLPTGNRTGSVKFLNLRTNKIVTRDEFKILLIPPYVITAMNELALRDGRKLTTKTTVHFGPHTSRRSRAHCPSRFLRRGHSRCLRRHACPGPQSTTASS